MKKSIASLALLAAAVAMPSMANAAAVWMMVPGATHPSTVVMDLGNAHTAVPGKKSKSIVQWNGSFTDLKNVKRTFTMIGTDPTSTNTSTSIKTIVIPIKFVYGQSNGNMTFDPLAKLKDPKKKTVISSMLASPLFDSGIDFVQGGTDLGQTQYIDAYQRGNFWSTVQNESSYHVLLNPTVADEQTITVTTAQGKVISNPFAPGSIGTMDINAFDSAIQGFMTKLKIKPNTFPLFISYNIYLTSGGCCIGGYHSANGIQPAGQTYGYSTYVDAKGSFSQDVSAISHEIGEWMDDPFTNNRVGCTDNSIMENGDPLEGGPNYGGFPYTLNGYTYNLQSLVFIDYFGAPKTIPVNQWLSFQNDKKTVCPGQQ